jgi:hypothetical protein
VALAKARYPCRSGLLIASRDEEEPDFYLITVRMHHHVAHEPYYDATLPPEMTQSIWETMGWRKNSPSPNMEAGEAASSDSDSDRDPSSDEGSPDPPPAIEEAIDPALELAHHENPPLEPEVYQARMRRHIAMIRDFCDGLEYQLPFNDYRMLEALESEGARFLRLVEDCLEKEGRLKETESGPPEAAKEDADASHESMEGVPAPAGDTEAGDNPPAACIAPEEEPKDSSDEARLNEGKDDKSEGNQLKDAPSPSEHSDASPMS